MFNHDAIGNYTIFDSARKWMGKQFIPGNVIGEMHAWDLALVLEVETVSSGSRMVRVFMNGQEGWLPYYAELDVIT